MNFNSISNFFDEMGVSYFTLAFRNFEKEAEFKKVYFQQSLITHRIFLFLGIIFISVFGVLDSYLFEGDVLREIYFIRFAFCIPVLIFSFLITFHKNYIYFWQFNNSFMAISIGSGITAMIIVAPSPQSYFYYAGLILVLMFLYTLIRARFITSFISGWIVTIAYLMTVLFFIDTPANVVANNSFFFVSANIIGMLACYIIEFYARNDYYLRNLLQIEQIRVEEALEEEKKLNLLKSRFINMTSHYFRSPLTVIMNSGSILDLIYSRYDSKDSEKYLGLIKDSVNELTDLLDRIHFIGKFDIGDVKNFPTRIDLGELIIQLINKLSKKYNIENRFNVEIESGKTFLNLDRELLGLTLENILSNALKFSDSGSMIRIYSYNLDGDFRISVNNAGEGFDGNQNFENSDIITDYPADISNSGMGLGYAIINRCCKKMNCSVDITNVSNDGITVSLVFKDVSSINAEKPQFFTS